MDNKFKLAQGVLDYLPNECYKKSQIENKILNTFIDFGYDRIDTPILERYELFDSGVGKVDLKKLFKVTDIDGDLLVLRPDMTMPISRIVSTKLPKDTYKLCYLGKSFSMLENGGKLREFTQVGVEVMGAKGVGVDTEVVALAIKSLLDAGLQNFQIELGHIGYFKGLLDSLELSLQDKEELTELVEKKDSIGEGLFAKRLGLDSQITSIILKLPMFFGGIEVLDEAEIYCKNDEMKEAISNLRKLYEGLKQLGYEKYISFDLSIVGNMKYYSALVMKGITKSVGRPILAGGRYDNLCDSFGSNTKAVGFAISIGYLLEALDAQGQLIKKPEVEIVIGFDNNCIDKAMALFEEYKTKKVVVKMSFATTIDQLKKCKEAAKANKAIYVSNDKIEEV